MNIWPIIERRPLIDVALGSLVLFDYRGESYYALAVESLRYGEPPSLLCISPKHPNVESAGILSSSVIGGGGTSVILIPEARATITDPQHALTLDHGYIAAGSLSYQHGELAIVCYVDTRSKGAYALESGKHLGEAVHTEYFKTWAIEVSNGLSTICLAKVTARPSTR